MNSLEILKSREAEVVEEFEFFDEWMDRYEHLIAQGKSLPAADPAIKTDDNLIRGCQSKVWITAEKRDGHVFFAADSDAIITADWWPCCCASATDLRPKCWPKQTLVF